MTGKESLKTGMSANKTNLTQTPKNAFWEEFGLQHINSNQLPIAGRLKYFIKNWEMVTNDPWVHNTISGYQICFTNLPYQNTIPSMIVSVEDQVVIDKEIEEMIKKTSHSICPTTSPQNKLSKYTVCGPQEGRRAKASVQPQTIKPVQLSGASISKWKAYIWQRST